MRSGLEELLDEVRLLWHVMVQAGERLHADEPVTLGMRGVLELLARDGPASVPQMARRRRVSRQHIQVLVDALGQRKLVALTSNPAHRRSALVQMTASGRRILARMTRRERRFFGGLELATGPQELRRGATTLGAVRQALERRP